MRYLLSLDEIPTLFGYNMYLLQHTFLALGFRMVLFWLVLCSCASFYPAEIHASCSGYWLSYVRIYCIHSDMVLQSDHQHNVLQVPSFCQAGRDNC
jgi:hypothetical protein